MFKLSSLSGDIQAFIDAVSEKRKQGDTEGE